MAHDDEQSAAECVASQGHLVSVKQLLTPFEQWLAQGIEAGWCSATACATHDGVPSTVEAQEEWDDGADPCEHVVRLYFDYETPL